MRIALGIVVILVGAQLLLSAMNVANVPNLGDWWPVLIIIAGALSLRSNPRTWLWPVAVALFGTALLLQNLGIIGGNVWAYLWPGLIILFGLQMLLGRSMEARTTPGTGGTVFTAFSGRNERVVGPFSSGTASAWFGGIQYDLRSATLGPTASLEVYAAFGGVEVLVPRSVKVVTRVTPLFGGSENKTDPAPDASTELTVHGTALFGGVDIKN